MRWHPGVSHPQSYTFAQVKKEPLFLQGHFVSSLNWLLIFSMLCTATVRWKWVVFAKVKSKITKKKVLPCVTYLWHFAVEPPGKDCAVYLDYISFTVSCRKNRICMAWPMLVFVLQHMALVCELYGTSVIPLLCMCNEVFARISQKALKLMDLSNHFIVKLLFAHTGCKFWFNVIQ